METGIIILSNIMIFVIIFMLATHHSEAAYFLRRIIKKRRTIKIMNTAMISEFIDKTVLVRDAVGGSQFEGKLIRVEDNWIQVERHTKKGVVSRLMNLDSVASIEIKD